MTAVHRLRAALDLLRPRTFLRSLARANRLADDFRELQAQFDLLKIRVEQLTSIERLHWEQRRDEARLDHALDAQRIGHRVGEAVEGAPIEADPFPHMVVTDWLPSDVYEAVIRGLPPPIFFEDREERRQRMTLPFELAPMYSQRVWRFLSDEVVSGPLARAVNQKFGPLILSYIRTVAPALPPDVDLTLQASEGRIMLRRPGYVIDPHRDPKWGFLTGLVYLVRKDDPDTYGTQLYRVRDDVEAPSGKPYYIDRTRCELVKSVPFRRNTMLVFMNSHGAHGASIPADAVPADLTRFVYQFRLGPSDRTIRQILSYMPPDERTSWAGSKSDRAGARGSVK